MFRIGMGRTIQASFEPDIYIFFFALKALYMKFNNCLLEQLCRLVPCSAFSLRSLFFYAATLRKLNVNYSFFLALKYFHKEKKAVHMCQLLSCYL